MSSFWLNWQTLLEFQELSTPHSPKPKLFSWLSRIDLNEENDYMVCGRDTSKQWKYLVFVATFAIIKAVQEPIRVYESLSSYFPQSIVPPLKLTMRMKWSRNWNYHSNNNSKSKIQIDTNRNQCFLIALSTIDMVEWRDYAWINLFAKIWKLH